MIIKTKKKLYSNKLFRSVLERNSDGPYCNDNFLDLSWREYLKKSLEMVMILDFFYIYFQYLTAQL